jgi:ABC-type sugar transport system substrate-binding protein
MVTFARCRAKLPVTLVVLALAVSVMLFLTACGSSSLTASSVTSSTVSSTSSSAAPSTQSSGLGSGLTVRVLGGPLADPFFGAVEKGGEDAAAQLGAAYEYLSPKDFSNAAQDLTQLIDTAINKKTDVFVVGDFIGPIEDPEIQKAVAAGITVVVYNSGRDTWQ